MSGVISSVITNSSAMVALNSLNTINSQLQTVQTAVSTGYSVSSAVDDGAAYAVAQSVRSNVSGLTSANQQLGGAQGLLSTATNGLNSASNMMQNIQATLVQLSGNNVTGDERTQYVSQLKNQIASISTDIKGSSYHGTNLINGTTLAAGSAPSVNVASDEAGNTINLTGFGGSAMLAHLSALATSIGGASGATTSAGLAAAALTTTGTFTGMSNQIGTALNTLGNTTNLVSNQITFNTNKIDALNNGVGALVDANMAQESAKLQSLQIQQQLATSALSIANQAPSLLTKLFG